jgi:hypothetical protein
VSADPAKPSKAERQADVALVVSYHEARLVELLERVREGFGRYDSGELDAFELDELIHRYKKATRELWKFCGDIIGSSAHFVARSKRCRKAARPSTGGSAEIPNVAVAAERVGDYGGVLASTF